MYQLGLDAIIRFQSNRFKLISWIYWKDWRRMQRKWYIWNNSIPATSSIVVANVQVRKSHTIQICQLLSQEYSEWFKINNRNQYRKSKPSCLHSYIHSYKKSITLIKPIWFKLMNTRKLKSCLIPIPNDFVILKAHFI